MTAKRILIPTVALLGALALVGPSSAAPKDKDKGGGPPPHAGAQGHGNGHGKHDDAGGVNIDIGAFFSDDSRQAARGYYGNNACPPGLAKKNNGCLPPGQAKKRYQLGQPVSGGVSIYPVPDGLRGRIGAPPPGYYYGYVDGDLLLLANATHKVIDAIVAVDAAGNALSR